MAANVNQKGYDQRLTVAKEIIESLCLQPSSITPLAYSGTYPYHYNNFLFKIELAAPAKPSTLPGTQPGTVAAPSRGVSTLVLKLSNLAVAEYKNTIRVGHDVAAQHLVRQSMAEAGLPPLIPDVYAWAPPAMGTDSSDTKKAGWILSEWRDGTDLDLDFPSLDAKDKEQVLDQIAAILRSIQTVKLPPGVNKFGGLSFDSGGNIVSAPSSYRPEALTDSYAEWKVSMLRKRLETAAKSPVIEEWKNNGVDVRIQKFLAGASTGEQFGSLDLQKKTLIHGDFTTNNMLFDEATKKITAVLDFDMSFISHPFEEFISFSSLHDIGGNIMSAEDYIKEAMLSGDFSHSPDNLTEESVQKWEDARAWNNAMKKNGVLGPSDIVGADKILDFMKLSQLLCPYELVNERMLKQLDDDTKSKLRAEAEARLAQWLDDNGC